MFKLGINMEKWNANCNIFKIFDKRVKFYRSRTPTIYLVTALGHCTCRIGLISSSRLSVLWKGHLSGYCGRIEIELFLFLLPSFPSTNINNRTNLHVNSSRRCNMLNWSTLYTKQVSAHKWIVGFNWIY